MEKLIRYAGTLLLLVASVAAWSLSPSRVGRIAESAPRQSLAATTDYTPVRKVAGTSDFMAMVERMDSFLAELEQARSAERLGRTIETETPEHRTAKPALTLSGLEATQGSVTSTVRNSLSSRAFSMPDSLSSMGKDLSALDGKVYVTPLTLKKDPASGKITISNIYQFANTEGFIAPEVEISGNTVTIPMQKILYHPSYGDICMANMKKTGNQVSYNRDPIIGTIDEQGNISLPSWGILVTEGPKKNSVFNVFSGSEWIVCNATYTSTGYDGKQYTGTMLIEQSGLDELAFYNMGGGNYGDVLYAAMTSQKKALISPQMVFNNPMLGDFYCFPTVESDGKVQVLTSGDITVTPVQGGFSIGGWVVSNRMYPTQYVAFNFKNTAITTTFEPVWPEVREITFDGAGTKDSPYLIKTADDLALLADAVNQGVQGYSTACYRMTADIDYAASGHPFRPIGNLSTPFGGQFDGDNHKISRFRYNSRGSAYASLFGMTAEGAVIKNLTMEGVAVEGSGENVAPVVGLNYGDVENVTVEGSVNSNGYYAGGIVAQNVGNLRNVSFTGSVLTCGCGGGLAGVSNARIEKGRANVSLTAGTPCSSLRMEVGGAVGLLYYVTSIGKEVALLDTYVAGSITDATGAYVTGGIVGYIGGETTRMERCFNTAVVQGSRAANSDLDPSTGGIVGYAAGGNVTDCYNAGTVLKNGESETAGGMVGYLSVAYTTNSSTNETRMTRKTIFTNCYNSGQVISSSSNGDKGLMGKTYYWSAHPELDPVKECIFNCFFDAQATGLKSATFGKPSSYFLSGGLPDGYAAGVWQTNQGYYPTLASSGNTLETRLSAAAMQLASGESVRKVKLPVTMSGGQGLQWVLFDSAADAFVTETSGMKISGNMLTVKDIYSNEILVCMAGDNFRMYRLAGVPKVFEGEGTAENPYLIKTVADLIQLHDAVGVHQQPHEGDFFRMTGDIDLNYTSEFRGIGAGYNSKIGFGGTFDGAGHTIRRLKIQGVSYDADGTAVTDGSYTCTGLFNCVFEEGTVKNLTLAADCSIQHWGLGGGFIGINNGRLENCRNHAAQSSIAQSTGGLVGQNFPTGVISRCYNDANIVNGYNTCGGIVGLTVGLVEMCQNDGAVEGKTVNAYNGNTQQSTVGGIAGAVSNGATMTDCINNGPVSAYAQVGGVAGSTTSVDAPANNIINCVNTAPVNCLNTVSTRGAIAGQNMNTAYTNCYYDGSVVLYDAVGSVADPGVRPLYSQALVAGTQVGGLDTQKWAFTKGYYPSLKDFENEPVGKQMRSIYLEIGQGITISNLQADVTLAPYSSIAWSLTPKAADDKVFFTLADGKLRVTVPQGMEVGRDTLTARVSDDIAKTFVVQTVPVIFDGQGTAADPYRISTVADMNNLADFVFNTGFDYANTHFRLMNDIDWAGAELNPVAKGGSVQFNGIFDGGGHTLRNYQLENTVIVNSPKGYQGRYIGIFGKVGSLGRVSNLKTEGGDVYVESYSGGIVGELYGVVENCTFRGKLRGKYSLTYLGGICCRVYSGGVVDNCIFEGELEAPGQYLGGIAAKSLEGGVIRNCISRGRIQASVNNAGVVAEGLGNTYNCVYEGSRQAVTSNFAGICYKMGANSVIDGCTNRSDIIAPDTTKQTNFSGIVGENAGGGQAVVRNCVNEGVIKCKGDAAGIMRYVKAGSLVLEDCVNKGDVTISVNGNYVGGIFDKTSSAREGQPIIVRRCANYGRIQGGYQYIGGIGGYAYDGVHIENCCNYGDVDSRNYASVSTIMAVGGIVGGSYGKVYRCYNLGDVTGVSHGNGGICGFVARGELRECFNAGNIASTGEKGTVGLVGGVAGYSTGAVPFYDCFNLGALTAPKKIGGIVSWISVTGDVPMENCYNAGKITVTGDLEDPVCSNLYVRTSAVRLHGVNLAFDNSINPAFPYDHPGAGMNTAALMSRDMGDKYVSHRACFPMLACFADDQAAALQSVQLLFTKSNDTPDNVNDIFFVGHPHDGLVYEVTGGLRMSQSDPGKIYPVALGPATISVKTADGTLMRTFPVTVNTATGVGEQGLDAPAVVSRTYYDMQGVILADPAPGSMVIVRTVYSDGTTSVIKAVVR